MPGFEPQTSSVRNDRTTKSAIITVTVAYFCCREKMDGFDLICSTVLLLCPTAYQLSE